MRNFKIIPALVLSTAILLTGCNGTKTEKIEKQPFPTNVLNVRIERKPNAVASLSPSLTNILIDLGYQANIVGFPSDTKIEGIDDSKKIGTELTPDFEKLAKMKTPPEIIFTNVPLTAANLTKLSQLGIKTLVMPNVKNIPELSTRYTQIIKTMEGEIEGTTSAIIKGKEIASQIDAIGAKIPTKQTFLYVTALDPIVATNDTIESSLLSVFGTNVAGTATNYNVTAEQLKTMNPDIIFFDKTLNAENIKENEKFKDKNAVKNDKLFAVDNQKLTLNTATAIDALTEIAKVVYPDIDFTAVKATSSQESSKS